LSICKRNQQRGDMFESHAGCSTIMPTVGAHTCSSVSLSWTEYEVEREATT
jgi:hypothetical protein